jgi:hypothetical protein
MALLPLADLSLTFQSAASSAQPQSQKSTTQSIGDTLSGNSNENQDSLLTKAKVSPSWIGCNVHS